MKQNLRKIVDEKIAKAESNFEGPTDQELLAFKQECLASKYPDYTKHKEYFSSPKGKDDFEKLKTFEALEILEEDPRTKKKFQKFKKLSESNKNTDIEEKNELHRFILEIIKLKKEKEKFYSKPTNEIQDLKNAYNYIVEADNYFDLLDVSDYKKANSSFNPFALLNKTQKFLSSFQGISIGTATPYFSKLSLSGLLVDGVQVELTPGIFYVSAVAGRSARETFNDRFTIPDLTLRQNLYGIKAGIGKTESSHLHLTFVDIKDVNSNLTLETNTEPMSNRLIGADAGLSLFNDNLFIEGEIVGSMIELNDEAESLAQNFSTEVPLSIFFPEASSSSVFDYAFRVGTDLNLSKAGLQLNGELERLNPNFHTLGTPTLLSNVMRWNASLRKSLFQKKIQLGFSARRDDNSLDPLLSTIDNMTEGYGADITIAFPKAPQIFASYQPFAQNSTILVTGEQQFTDTEITNVNVTIPYKFGEKFTASTSLSYLNQTMDSNIDGVNTNVTNYSLNQSFNFQPFGVKSFLASIANC